MQFGFSAQLNQSNDVLQRLDDIHPSFRKGFYKQIQTSEWFAN